MVQSERESERAYESNKRGMRNEKKFNSMEIRIQISFSPEMENQKRIQLDSRAKVLARHIVTQLAPFLSFLLSLNLYFCRAYFLRERTHCYLNINWLRMYIAKTEWYSHRNCSLVRTLSHLNWKYRHTWTHTQPLSYSLRLSLSSCRNIIAW